MKVRKVINRPIDISADGVNISGGVNAVVSASVDEKGGTNSVSKRQTIRVVQTSRKQARTKPSEDDIEAASNKRR